MKPLFFILLSASFAMAAEFTLKDGSAVAGTVSREEPDGLSVMTESGIKKIPFDQLPEAVQKQYNYDASKAAGFQRKQAEAKEEAARKSAAQVEAAKLAEEKRKADLAKAIEARKPTPKPTPVDNTPKIGGFLGMPWGTSQEEAKATMLAREGVTLKADESTPTHLNFIGGTFSDNKVKFTSLSFLEGKLVSAMVVLEYTASERGVFFLLVDALNKKYPERGSGNTNRGFMKWKFPDSETVKESITLHNDGGNVTVLYEKSLTEAESSKLDAQQKSEISTKDL